MVEEQGRNTVFGTSCKEWCNRNNKERIDNLHKRKQVMEEKIVIPQQIENICRELSKKATELGLDHLSGKFSVDFLKNEDLPRMWRGEISFAWRAGRHGEEMNEVSLTLQAYHAAKVNI